MAFREQRLSNGLEIVAECNPEAHSTAVAFFVRTGSRDETDAVAGVSHFLEHMVFKGTPTRSAEDVNREFDEIGSHCNAFTTEEHTVYHAAMLPEYQTAAVELLCDIIRPALRAKDFKTEKKVILEEIQMYEDQPPFLADDKCRAVHYGSHPLGRSVLGTIESVAALPVKAMRQYFERRYSPGNMALVGAGRIDFEALVDTARRIGGDWPAFETGRDTPPAPTSHHFLCLRKESATMEYAIELANAPSATDPDRYAAKVLATILGDDSGSRLYWELVHTGLAEHASLGHHDYEGAGLFTTYMSCDPRKAQANLRRIARIYRRAETAGITAEELAQAKSKINSRVVLASERPRSRLFTVGGNWVERREYRTVRDDLQAIDAVTLDDLARVLSRYPLSTNTTLAIGPLEKMSPPNGQAPKAKGKRRKGKPAKAEGRKPKVAGKRRKTKVATAGSKKRKPKAGRKKPASKK